MTSQHQSDQSSEHDGQEEGEDGTTALRADAIGRDRARALPVMDMPPAKS